MPKVTTVNVARTSVGRYYVHSSFYCEKPSVFLSHKVLYFSFRTNL